MSRNPSHSNGTVSSIPPNNSQQKLVAADYLAKSRNGGTHSRTGSGSNHISSSAEDSVGHTPRVTAREWITVAILCFVNLINYMDRFTIAGK